MSLSLSRAKLVDFLTCQRRFQLRHLQQLVWPAERLNEPNQAALERGQAFHQLVERHYLGLETPESILNLLDADVRRWWFAFLSHGPKHPPHQSLLAEMSLTVTIAAQTLLGRFDLIAIDKNTSPHVHIYDWKTGKPRSAEDLRTDWQTRLYLLLVVAGRDALGLPHLQPEEVAITYWYARQPAQAITLRYDAAMHGRDLADLTAIIHQINNQLAEPPTAVWPLTDNLEACTTCRYKNYCGRFDVPELVERLLGERALWEDELETDEAEATDIVWEPLR